MALKIGYTYVNPFYSANWDSNTEIYMHTSVQFDSYDCNIRQNNF